MALAADGLNKPFDRIVKAFADEAPALFLRVTGVAPPGAEVDIQPIRPETAPAVILPDYVAVLSVGGGEPFAFHAEFYLDWATDIPRNMARYGGSLAWQYQRLVISVMLLLRRERAPAEVPDTGEYTIGHTRTTHPYRVVRAWEVDPAAVLETGDPKMLPWAILMNSSDAQVRQIAVVLREQGDDESIARFLTLGSIRYDRNQLEAMLEGTRMGFVEAIMEGSSLVQEVRDKALKQGVQQGVQQGHQRGVEEGRIEEARRLLRVCLRTRFAGLEAVPEIDAIGSLDAIEALLQNALTVTDSAEIQRQIAAAAR